MVDIRNIVKMSLWRYR